MIRAKPNQLGTIKLLRQQGFVVSIEVQRLSKSQKLAYSTMFFDRNHKSEFTFCTGWCSMCAGLKNFQW